MIERPSRDDYFIAMARLVATRSTCLRRAVGCVLVDSRGHVLATGYNGVAMGQDHCNEPGERHANGEFAGLRFDFEHACEGWDASSGSDLSKCGAIHAEQNALLQCHDAFKIETAYITVSPCVHCTKILMNTSTIRIVFAERYAHDDEARALWFSSNVVRGWIEHPLPERLLRSLTSLNSLI